MAVNLSIIMPAYNESECIGDGVLQTVRNWVLAGRESAEIIVVDDGSSDGTATAAESSGQADRVLKLPHGGKGTALVNGMKVASGDVWLLLDIDLETPIAEATQFLDALYEDADLVIGNRGHRREHAPFYRRVISRLMPMFNQLALGLTYEDTQCGMKLLRRSCGEKILPELESRLEKIAGFSPRPPSVQPEFDLLLLMLARKHGFRIREVPVRWSFRRAQTRYSAGREGLHVMSAWLRGGFRL